MNNQTSILNDANLDAVSGGVPLSTRDATTLRDNLVACGNLMGMYGDTAAQGVYYGQAYGVQLGAGLHPK